MKTHLGAIKRRLLDIKKSLEELDYWTKENELGVVELVNEDIKRNCRIMKLHLKRLSDKF